MSALPRHSELEACTTMDCDRPATRRVTCEGEGSYPYCDECSRVLVDGGEVDLGPVEEVPIRFRIDIKPQPPVGWLATVYDMQDHGPEVPYASASGALLDDVLRQASHYVWVAS